MKNATIIMLAFLATACNVLKEDKIKQGNFDRCPNHKVESLVESFFRNPKWESYISPDDNKFHLNASGSIFVEGVITPAIIQFEMVDDERWKINAFVLNGEPQPDQMIYSLIDAMCEEASN